MAVNAITLSARNPMRNVLLAILIFEVIVFGLAVPVMIFNSDVPPGLTQLVGLALGVLTPTMIFIGALFAGLWVLSFVLGKRLDASQPSPG
jgi:hypothetical protein